MSDYFSELKRGLGDAVEHRSHLRWYSRLRLSHGRGLVVLFATLVIATPAVGAISGWFSFGKPNVGPAAHAGIMYGLEKPGSSRLLPMRTPDPFGGPAWGLRLVRTSRGDTCVQLGRVENDQIGSLGIDDAWDNDHKFHPISAKDSAADQCGSTDAAGYGYVNVGMVGTQASADIYHQGQGNARSSQGCTPPQYASLVGARHRPMRPRASGSSTPECRANAGRVIFFGMLGPDATSVTYRKPGGGTATQRTAGGVGEYLLVFPYDEATCYEYTHSANGSVSCDSESMGSASPGLPGAITKITYKDGHSCTLAPSAHLESAFRAFELGALAKLGRPPNPPAYPGAPMTARRTRWLARYRHRLNGFLARVHLTQAELSDELGPAPSCPAVGWVAPKRPKVTAADVATPIIVRQLPAGRYGCPVPVRLQLPQGCNGASPTPTELVPIEWSFKARRAVTNSRSWYEWGVWPASSQTGTNCGGTTFATYTNIDKGQMLRYSQLYPLHCRGKYVITVGYVAAAPSQATDDTNGGGNGSPGTDGSVIVGRTSFTIR
jgi:hypothetical protein